MNLKDAIETAFAYHRDGNLVAAEQVYDQILCQIDKPDPNCFFGLGTLLISKQMYGQGIIFLQAALQHAPDYAPGLTNLACAYKHLGKDDLALEAYTRANDIDPNQPDILAGLAGFYINKNEAQHVIDYAKQALALDPNHAAANMHMGLGLLEQGKFEQAWPFYEYRWETLERIKDKRPYKAPRWRGEKVRRLAIHGEQGLGDEIMFMSALPLAQVRAEQIVVECAERLIPAFRASFPGVEFYKDHEHLTHRHPSPDAYIPMASLPIIVGLPDGRPFLKRDKSPTPRRRPLIGIAWKGGTLKTNVRDRSLTLSDFRPILDNEDVEFCSVQYGSNLGDELTAHRINNAPTDFVSLHQRIADCDLVISVCQTAVHQAGAMGVETWCLVPERAAWRYAGKDFLPWYGSVKFFKQVEGSWTVPINEIATLLKQKYAALAA